jgi:hypothetical protein
VKAYRFAAWISFLLLLAVAAGAQLIGPPVPDERQEANCVHNVRISERLGISLSCDSNYFVWLSVSPHHLYDAKAARQSRPGVVFITFLMAQPLRPLANLPRWIGMPEPAAQKNQWGYAREIWAREAPTFLAYIVFNFALLIATFWFLLRAIGPFGPSGAWAGIGVGAIASLLTANVVTKMFLWSPHTQLFNIFVPVFAIVAAVSILQSGLTRRQAIVFGLIIGVGMTVYPVFPIALALIVLAALLRRSRDTAANLAVLLAYSVVPYLIWYSFVRLKTGDFYSHEIHGYNQVGWIIDAWRDGVLPRRFAKQLWWMIKGVADWNFAVLAALAIAGWLALRVKDKMEPVGRSALASLGALSSIVVVAGLLLFAIIGLAEPRTAYIMVPPFIVFAAALFAASSQLIRPPILALATLALLAVAILNIAEVALHRVVWI